MGRIATEAMRKDRGRWVWDEKFIIGLDNTKMVEVWCSQIRYRTNNMNIALKRLIGKDLMNEMRISWIVKNCLQVSNVLGFSSLISEAQYNLDSDEYLWYGYVVYRLLMIIRDSCCRYSNLFKIYTYCVSSKRNKCCSGYMFKSRFGVHHI